MVCRYNILLTENTYEIGRAEISKQRCSSGTLACAPTNPQIRNAYDIYVDDIITAYFHKKLLNDANSISYDQVSSLLKVITNILNPINLDTSKKVKGISNSIKWYNDNENPGYTWDPSEMGVDFNIK